MNLRWFGEELVVACPLKGLVRSVQIHSDLVNSFLVAEIKSLLDGEGTKGHPDTTHLAPRCPQHHCQVAAGRGCPYGSLITDKADGNGCEHPHEVAGEHAKHDEQ